MQRKHWWQKLAYVFMSVWLISGMLLPATAFADDKGKNNNTAKPAQAQTPKQDDKKDDKQTQAQTSAPKNDDKKDDDNGKPASSTQTQTQAPAAKQDDKKSGDLPGGTMGKSSSNPDGGGVDKPYDAAGQKANTQRNIADTGDHLDGNNGCGQDKRLDDARETGTLHLGYDDNNGWCGKKPEHDKNVQTSSPPSQQVHVKGCYVWNNDKDKPFYINEQMTEEQAKAFESSTKLISDNMDGCKNEGTLGEVDTTPNPTPTPPPANDHVKIWVCHRTGSMSNPFVLIHVSVNAQGHLRDDSHDRHDIHVEDIVFGETKPNNWEEVCKLPDTKSETKSFPLSGCFYNPVTKEFVFFKHQTFGTQAEVDAKVQGLVAQAMNQGDCKHQPTPTPNPTPTPPTVLGTTDTNPNPGPSPVNMYGCFQKADGTYVHENRTFASQAEMDAYKASQGYIGVNASTPNPDQCKNPDKPGNPPSDNRPSNPPTDAPGNPPVETAGVQIEQPGAARESASPLTVPALSIDRFITTAEARQELPAPAPASEGVQALISEVPAAPVAQAITPQQPAPAPRPTTSLLPTTGEPMVDLALLTLGFLGLTLLGLRFLRTGTHRA